MSLSDRVGRNVWLVSAMTPIIPRVSDSWVVVVREKNRQERVEIFVRQRAKVSQLVRIGQEAN